MKQLKKTLLTLVALLALTTQAWAESKPIGLNVEYAAGDVITTNSTGDVYIWWGYYLSGEDIQEGAIKITSSVSPTISMLKISESTGYIRLVDDYSVYDKDGNIIQEDPEIQCQGMVTGTALEKVYVKSGSGTLADPYVFAPGSAPAAASGPEVDWDKAEKTGTFTMPGGNVTLEPEYYPQAALTAAPTAINDVPATTDGAIVSAGTVKNIGETTNAQGTVMYYVSKSPLDDAALLALAADKWTADVPTAAGLAQGQAYVYYYVRGNDSDTDAEIFSDGDILATNALTVTIAAEPTYAVTFAEGVNPEPPAQPEWTASPATGVTKGQTVTVTYSGSKKVIGVKAEKKAKATTPTLNITSPVVGQVIGSDGKNYDANATLPDGVTAVAMIAYVGSETGVDGYTHGLALALSDDYGYQTWTDITSHSPAVTGGIWLLASEAQWNKMINAMGSDGLRDGFSSVGGTNLENDYYWSSTAGELGHRRYAFNVKAWYNSNPISGKAYGRACLAF